MNTALDSCTPLVRAPGLTWPNRCSAFSFGERWRDSMSMMWRSSKTGFGTQSRGGIVTRRLSSGEASGMRAATAPMRVVIGRVDQGLPPRMCCRDAFVPCAITNGSAMPSQMASDPLVQIFLKLGVDGGKFPIRKLWTSIILYPGAHQARENLHRSNSERE